MWILLSRACMLLCITLLSTTPVCAQVDYTRDIKPLLAQKCTHCHGPLKQEAGLRLDAGSLVKKGGESGLVINPQDPESSLLYELVTSEDVDLQMPPLGEGEKLKPEQLKQLKDWIAAGAPHPASEEILASPDEHWAYQIPIRPEVPQIDSTQQINNPIDAFFFDKLKQKNLKLVPQAERAVLLRRAYLDLIGLPPTPDEQQKFLADSSPDATNRMIDHLLENPAYGERWGRHWMDVWRYSDWDGYKQQVRGSQRHIWRWREWIIESLNQDKGYDQMVVEMLAGDEVAPEHNDTLRATGYLVRSFHKSNRNIWLDATVEHTAKAFLGMTINCARCHDHKFDPIAQTEYYAMRAIFEPHNVRTERLPGESNLIKQGLVRAYDAKLEEPTYLYVSGNEKNPDKENPSSPAPPKLIKIPYNPEPVTLPLKATFPTLTEFVRNEEFAKSEKALQTSQAKLKKLSQPKDQAAETEQIADLEIAKQKVLAAQSKLASLKSRWDADLAKFETSANKEVLKPLTAQASELEHQNNIIQTRLTVLLKTRELEAANASAEKDEAKKKAAITKAEKAFKEAKAKSDKAIKPLEGAAKNKYTSVGKQYPATSTGRRSAFARWITHRKNPLTARVAVNHIWLRHFGEPLVENVFDFGLRSPTPAHVEILDWLAVELIENNWSMKHVHRLIMTSRMYQLASTANHDLLKHNKGIDPDNLIFWRANARRLDAEVIRDSVFYVSGSLDQTRGGPDIDFREGETTSRRSIYFRHAYEKQMTMLVTFDAAGPNECYRRSESIIPQQALALTNSALAINQSRLLAKQLSKTATNNENFIHAAYENILCRSCSSDELSVCLDFLVSQERRLKDKEKLVKLTGKTKATTPASTNPLQRAKENLVHVLINHNDFVTIH